jgi:Rrf2 family iron-sulfur cluster assembly transcriptional regulator
MQLTTRGRYGVMAMVELAARGEGHRGPPVGLADIAARQQLSLCYLEQLFAGLKRAGLVVSVRGPGGGYRLARPPGAVTIADILAAVGERMRVGPCEDTPPGDTILCRTHDLWEALGSHLNLFLSNVTLADVLAGEVCGFAPIREAVA